MKNSYQTRRLLALRDMRHDGQNVITGGEVFATETDASYLIRSGHAREADQPIKEQTKVVADSPPTRRGPGRPPKVEVAARAPTPAPASAPKPDAGAPDESSFGTGGGEPNPGAGINEDGGAGGADESGHDAGA